MSAVSQEIQATVSRLEAAEKSLEVETRTLLILKRDGDTRGTASITFAGKQIMVVDLDPKSYWPRVVPGYAALHQALLTYQIGEVERARSRVEGLKWKLAKLAKELTE